MSAELHFTPVVGNIFGGIWTGIEIAVIAAINSVISALATAINGLLSILPDMPALPTLPSAFVTAEGWVAWFFPVGTVADILVWGTTVFLVWQAASLILRWAKGIN
jgi:uncharacterized membrane protein YkgB